jgi:glycosyltransferase involved in cell wall biosynthesis
MSVRDPRVVLISPLPPPSGGVATWTANLLEYWKVIGSTKSNIKLTHISNARRFGIITERRISYRILWGLINSIFFFFRYLVVLRPGNKQIVHVTCTGHIGMLRDVVLIYFFRLFGGKVVTHIRFGRIPQILFLNNWEGILIRLVIKNSTAIISIDEPTFTFLNQYNTSITHYLPNAISNSFLNLTMDEILLKEELSQPTILFVGHVVSEKGIYDLIEAAGKLGDLCIKIAGIVMPNDAKKVHELQIKYPSLTILLLGNLSQQQLFLEFRSCTIFCLPSYTEGFPNSVLEAMASGAPIVASSVGHIPEMVRYKDYTAAWLFNAGDKERLQILLKESLANEHERQKNARLCRLKVLSFYTSENVYGQLIRIWENTLQL